jgi:hypothetical protein
LRQQAEVREIEEQLSTARSAAATAWAAVAPALAAFKAAPSSPRFLGSNNGGSRPGTAGSQQPGAERQLPTQPMSQPLLWSTPSAAPPGVRAVPDEVIVERRRNLGQRTLRLWVEDCANRGGVRVHATDPESLAEVHVDLRDSDVQVLFHGYCQTLAASVAASGAAKQLAEKDHGEQLLDFMGCLLDSAFLELDPKNHTLQLRLPATVDPPVPLPPPSIELATTPSASMRGKPSDPAKDSLLSKEWIREKLLTPCRPASARSSRPGSAASRVLRSSVGAAYRQALSVTASRRPQSARRSQGMHFSRRGSNTPRSSSGFSNILSRGNVSQEPGDFSRAPTGSNSSGSVGGPVMEQWVLLQDPPTLSSSLSAYKRCRPTVPSGLDLDVKVSTPHTAWGTTRRRSRPCSRSPVK